MNKRLEEIDFIISQTKPIFNRKIIKECIKKFPSLEKFEYVTEDQISRGDLLCYVPYNFSKISSTLLVSDIKYTIHNVIDSIVFKSNLLRRRWIVKVDKNYFFKLPKGKCGREFRRLLNKFAVDEHESNSKRLQNNNSLMDIMELLK